MSQEAEPSLIEYARFHGLSKDYLEHHPLEGIAPPLDFLSQLEDSPDLVHIEPGDFKLPKERLTVDAGAASLLAEVAALAKPVIRSDEDDGLNLHRFRNLKLELPLLRTDHELDMLRFAPQVVPDLEHEFLPYETVDEEADEGLTWPSRCHELPSLYWKKVESEKLQVSRDALQFLQQSLQYHLEGGNHEAFEVDDIPYERKHAPSPVSSPLLPLSPTVDPYVPSSDTGRLEFLSEPTSPTREEAQAAEKIIFAGDAILPAKALPDASSQISDPMLLDSENLGDIYSPLKGIADPPSSPPPLRAPLEDRKVSVPLSSPRPEQIAPWDRKKGSISEILPELLSNLPTPIPKSPGGTSSDDINTFIKESIAPAATDAKRSIENEQLHEADATCRVAVPVMDFSLPVAPWKANNSPRKSDGEDSTYKQTLAETKALHFSNHTWPISDKNERELQWAPFPAALGKMKKESISYDSLVEEFVSQPDPVDAETLTWKPEGLRIFDDLSDSDEEELEQGTFPEENNIDVLIRKRKLELDEDENSPPSLQRKPMVTTSTPSSKDALERRSDEPGAIAPAIIDPKGFFMDTFSTMNALDVYLYVRKGEIRNPQLKADNYFPKQLSPVPPKAEFPTRDLGESTRPKAPAQSLPIPSPNLIVPTVPCQFIISASFLSNRRISRQIQRLFPSAEFIERDFTLYQQHSRTAASPRAQFTRIRADPSADEADMILSPGTGLIWTTLQKIKQRPLPGQVAHSAIRERIARAAPRYERLIILISENCLTVDGDETVDIPGALTHALDASDCEALAELTSFCSTLPCETHPVFVAGTEDDLARWIVAMMIKHGVCSSDSDSDIKLLSEETQWENFLQRAGMNAFAAQAVLARLKKPAGDVDDDDDHRDVGKGAGAYGLGAFVKMGARERIAKFEMMMGGTRLLEAVGEVLDARW